MDAETFNRFKADLQEAMIPLAVKYSSPVVLLSIEQSLYAMSQHKRITITIEMCELKECIDPPNPNFPEPDVVR